MGEELHKASSIYFGINVIISVVMLLINTQKQRL